MVDFETLGEGITLGGVYTLERYIRRDRAGAFFVVFTGDGERLLIKLAPEQCPEAERQFTTWQRSRHLRHAHLQDLRDVGRAELEGNSYIYGVFEYPDDLLAPALEQGPLSEPETRGVLEAVLAGLRYLHGQGLVHGAVDPDHIVAVGEKVKLATDALRESDDLEGHPEDVRQLGELVRSLRAPEPLGEPFATIVRHATAADARQRWTLAEIAGVIGSAPTVTSVAPAMPAPVPSAVTPVAPAMLAVPSAVALDALAVPEPVPSTLTPIEPAMAAPAPPVSGEADVRSPGGFPKWIVAGLAILLLSILMFNLRRKPDTEPDMAPVTLAPQAANRPIAPSAVTAPPSARGDVARDRIHFSVPRYGCEEGKANRR
jgi:eukaryotic-like serine/threonine-protein kinase